MSTIDHLESSLYAFAAAVVFLALCYVGLVVRKKLTPLQLPLPPGPKGRPFIGSALEIDRREPWLTFKEWKELYGDVVSCNLFGQIYVIVNSERAAKALFEQRSIKYSGRPAVRICSLFGMNVGAGRPSCDDVLSSRQGVFYQNLDGSMDHDSVVGGTRALLDNLLHSPGHFENHLRTYAASVVTSATYGYNIIPRDHPLELAVEEMMRIVTLLTPERAIWVHRFPRILNLPSWLQGTEFRRWARRWKEVSPKIRDAPFQFVKASLDVENDSAVAQLLKDKNAAAAQDRLAYEQDVQDCATSNFIAGVYTTQAALSTFILALVLHPGAQDRAHAELDRVVGRHRLPAFSDRASLHYVGALLQETLRWSALVPMAIPHKVTKDIIFQQRLIPQGSVVLQNLWEMSRDEDNYSNPSSFNPDRHLDADGNLFRNTPSVFFCCGRSTRPGSHLVDSAIWLAAARMLSIFRFGKAIGPVGYEIDVFPKFMGGVARRPVPFSCRIAPRFEEALGSFQS